MSHWKSFWHRSNRNKASLWAPLVKPVGAWAHVQGKVRSRRRGLGATQLHLGEMLEDGWGLARWGIPLWLSFSSSLRRSSPGLAGSKRAAVGQTHWLRGFPRELKNHLSRHPLVLLCRLKFGPTPFPLPAKTPLPIKIRDNKEKRPSVCLCPAHASPGAAETSQQLPSLTVVRRRALCAFVLAAQLVSIIPADIWTEVEEEWNYFWEKKNSSFSGQEIWQMKLKSEPIDVGILMKWK